MKTRSLIEPLEDRIAPATIINPYTVTYQNYETNSGGTQIQGDVVVVKISKPLFATVAGAQYILQFTNVPNGTAITESFTGNSTAESLGVINLAGVAAATGMNISVYRIPQVGVGNGDVAVGDINAAVFSGVGVSGNIALGSIYIQGALEQITAGGSYSDAPGIQSLTVGSFGGNGNAPSEVIGLLPKLTVLGNFTGNLSLTSFQFGVIGQLYIGGSLTGDSAGDGGTGIISFPGHIGSATIGNIIGTGGQETGTIFGISGSSGINSLHVTGSITGGAATDSGIIFLSTGNIGHLTVDGSITGGAGLQSGEAIVSSGSIGHLAVGGSITGGSGQESGEIDAHTGGIGTVYVGGSITGGSGIDSGVVAAGGTIGKLWVTGSIIGGTAGTAADALTSSGAVPGDSGVVQAAGLGTAVIGGSLVGGTPIPADVSADGTQDQTADTSGAIIVNSIGSLTVMGSITANGGPNSAIITGQTVPFATGFGTIVVDGSLTGGAGALSGAIFSNGFLAGSIGNLHIAGNVTGSTGSQSGYIAANYALGSVFVGGNVVGGTVDSTGEVSAAVGITSLHIGGNLTGGSGTHSGYVTAGGTLGTLYIGGNVTGGSADNTGEIFAAGALTTATIHGNLEGNAGGTPLSSTAAVVDAGYIQANHIGMLGITGSVTSGTNSMGPIANSGAIRSSTDIGSIIIAGAVTGSAGSPVIISAQQGPGTSTHLTSDLAIGSVTVDGAATYLDILAGYSPLVSTQAGAAAAPLGTPLDGAAQIGTLTFLSTLSASNVVAGATPDGNEQFGTSGSTAILPRSGAFGVLSTIAKIVVTDAATGDTTTGDNFGFEAESLGTVVIDGTAVPTNALFPGTPAQITGNLFLLEPLQT